MKTINYKLALTLVAAIALLATVAPVTAHADRVGNGGVTVELALTKLSEKVPGVDNYHKILYAFENGSRVDVEKYSGVWSGLTFWQGRSGGVQVSGSHSRFHLGLNTLDAGPILDKLEKGWICLSTTGKCIEEVGGYGMPAFLSQWRRLEELIGAEVRSDGASIFVSSSNTGDRGLAHDWLRLEFRAYKGIIVGVMRKHVQRDGTIVCPVLDPDRPMVAPLDDKTPCAVLYLFNRKSIRQASASE